MSPFKIARKRGDLTITPSRLSDNTASGTRIHGWNIEGSHFTYYRIADIIQLRNANPLGRVPQMLGRDSKEIAGEYGDNSVHR